MKSNQELTVSGRDPCLALFVCDYHESLRSTVLPLCQALNSDGPRASHIILERATDKMIGMCEEARVAYTVRSRAAPTRKSSPRPPRRLNAIRWLLIATNNLVRVRPRIMQLTKQIDQYAPTVIVLLDDRTPFTCRWVRAAQLRGIPTVVVQWAAVHHAETMVSIRAAQQSKSKRSWFVRLLELQVAKLVPNAVAHHQGDLVWYLSADRVLAAWFTQTFPKHTPWAYGGGNADRVATLGRAWKRRMLKDGVPEEKIVVTGHPDQDAWWHMRSKAAGSRCQVLDQLGVSHDARLVTIIAPALCMRQARGLRLDTSVDEIRNSLRTAVVAVARMGENFVPVLKVHPRDSWEDLASLRDTSERIRIVKDIDTHRLIAASEAMACQWSSSAMIGQAVGTPVVLFDFENTASAQVWRDIESLPVARSEAEFCRLLQDVLRCPTVRANLLKKQQAFVDDYLCLDGQSTMRLVSLIRDQSRKKAG